jgi:RimJ/RimL family protein N-acetyltransferase
MTDPTWRNLPDLEGRHVTLRALDPADRESLLAAFADGLDGAFTTIVPSAATIDGWLASLLREREAGRAFPYTVLDAESRICGTTRYLRISPPHRRLEIGGTIHAKRVQRTALNTEAKKLLLTHAFEVLGCQVVQFRTDWLNRRSRLAIERLGAKMDGVLRAHLVMPDGRVRDTVVYSVTSGEWAGVRANLTALLSEHAAGTSPGRLDAPARRSS